MTESTQNPHSPFKGGLKNFESVADYAPNSIFLLGADPEKVVRRLDPLGITTTDYMNMAHKAKTLRKDLFTNYGIETIDYNMIQAQDTERNQPTIYALTDRIHGYTIADRELPADIVKNHFETFDNFYTSLTSYLLDTYKKGGDMLLDIEPHQFMFGHTKADPSDRIYLTDLEPLVVTIEPLGKNKEQEDRIFSMLHSTYDSIKLAENKAGQPLKEARKNLLAKLQVIPESSRFGYYTQSIQPILDELQTI